VFVGQVSCSVLKVQNSSVTTLAVASRSQIGVMVMRTVKTGRTSSTAVRYDRVFSSRQTAKLPVAEAADLAQCVAPN